MLLWRRWGERRLQSDRGSASLEFLGVGLLLLLPTVYLILVMAALQGAALAAEGAARHAARMYAVSPDDATGRERAERAIAFGLEDFGIHRSTATVGVECRPRPASCLTRAGTITVVVRVEVVLPLLPEVVAVRSRGTVPVEASATAPVSRLWGSE
ncbi:hypothetical protein ACL9RL_07140 [Plantibacter sp. Mn2098]|uniref:hypothetical protein n=1 Tax=Plantibacter sp. Mn2098 TaxID=3395266 RepID=UPI003BC9CA3E